METVFEKYKQMIDKALAASFKTDTPMPQQRLLDSMDYSLTAGGKRLRPLLVMLFCDAAGGNAETAIPVACGVEMLHTYSLIHDDLPCMDNDELRRGKPTNHMVFGECTATLAGDALQAEAFGAILRSDLPADVRANCAEALADAAGVDGICGGQQLDMGGEGKKLTEDELVDLQGRKTGSLILCACKMGAIVGNANPEQIETACIYGASLGAAFQIRDDMLDELSNETELGKPIGSDVREGKTTFMTLYGAEKCAQMVSTLTERAKSEVRSAFENPENLCRLADLLCDRKN